jgi:hypothetical protein
MANHDQAQRRQRETSYKSGLHHRRNSTKDRPISPAFPLRLLHDLPIGEIGYGCGAGSPKIVRFDASGAGEMTGNSIFFGSTAGSSSAD